MALALRQDLSTLGGGLFKRALAQTSAAWTRGWWCSGHCCCSLAPMMVNVKACPTLPEVAMKAKLRWPPKMRGSRFLKPWIKGASTKARHFVCLFRERERQGEREERHHAPQGAYPRAPNEVSSFRRAQGCSLGMVALVSALRRATLLPPGLHNSFGVEGAVLQLQARDSPTT